MTTPLHNTVTLTDSSDVIAAVPHLLGFRPVESLVVLATTRAGAGVFDLTVRVELPVSGDYTPLRDQLFLGPLARSIVEGVVLVVISAQPTESVGPPGVSADLPHRALIDLLEAELADRDIPVLHSMWTSEIVADAAWACYGDEECQGRIQDPKSSELAAAVAAAGGITFASRQELAELVAPESEAALAQRSAQLDLLYDETEAYSDSPERLRQHASTLLEAIERTDGGDELTDDELLPVLVALSDPRIRDCALGFAEGPLARSAERLWMILVRKAPEPEMHEAAALLAFYAYLRGDGALASVVLERVERTRPEHRLGSLLRQSLNIGVLPRDLAMVARNAAQGARELLEEDARW